MRGGRINRPSHDGILAGELEHVALNDAWRANRMPAVIALRKTLTARARQALEGIAQVSSDPAVSEAARLGIESE